MGCSASMLGTLEDNLSVSKSREASPDVTDGAGDRADSNSDDTVEAAPNSTDLISNLKVERFVAYEIPIRESCNDIDAIFKRPLPPRLQHLAPLENPPMLSAERLKEKQTQAEEKLFKSAERRKTMAQNESQKLDRLPQVQEDRTSRPTDAAMRMESANRKREANLRHKQKRQHLVQERVRQAKERVRKMREREEVDYEIEKFNETSDSEGEGQKNAWLVKKPEAAPSDCRKPQPNASGHNSRDVSPFSAVSCQDLNAPGSLSQLIDDDFFDRHQR